MSPFATAAGKVVGDRPEHVAIVEEWLLKEILAARPADEAIGSLQREAIILKRAGDRRKRVDAPEAATPLGRFPSVAAATAHFLESRKKAIEFAETCRQDPRSLQSFHLVLGSVNAYENLLMLALHPRRHAEQIRETRMLVQDLVSGQGKF